MGVGRGIAERDACIGGVTVEVAESGGVRCAILPAVYSCKPVYVSILHTKKIMLKILTAVMGINHTGKIKVWRVILACLSLKM